MDIEKLLNEPPIYTAYYSNDFGNQFSAFLTQDPSVASVVDCDVVKSEDYMALLEYAVTLRAENAKLIANIEMLHDHIAGDSEHMGNLENDLDKLENERDKLLAEREQWMKQEPYGYVYSSNLDNNILHFSETKPSFSQEDGWEYEISTTRVFREPLPAQQVPIYQWNSTNDKTLWVDCNKDVYDIMRDEHKRIVYLSEGKS